MYVIIIAIGLMLNVAPSVSATGSTPITLDSVTTSDDNGLGSVSSLSWSHTVASGVDILIVGVSENSFPIPPDVVGVTFGSSSLTLIGRMTGGSTHVELWSLSNPSTGTALVIVTLAFPEVAIVASASSYFNVLGTTSFSTSTDNGGTVTSPSITVPAASGDLVMDVLATTVFSSTPPVPSPGSTATYVSGIINAELFAGASEEPAASPVTLSWVYTSSDWALAGVALMPTAPPVGGVINSVNQLQILLPWFVMITVLSVVVVEALVVGRRKIGN